MLQEVYGTGYNDRIYVIRKWGTTKLTWKVTGFDIKMNKEDWRIDNETVPVPVGEWFLLEAFLKGSSSSDGRFLVKVNGETIADHKGRTNLTDTMRIWSTFKVYTSGAAKPAFQWIDDFEIWSDIP